MIRRVDDGVVTVQLQFIDGPLSPNTWVLVGIDQTVTILSCAVFRRHLAFVNHECEVRMDEVGDIVTDGVYVLIGAIRINTYDIDLDRRYCSCKSYQYRRTQHRDRNCKHLNSLCTPSYAVRYTKEPQAFQLISDAVPKKHSVYADWVYSEKHDGIRVRVQGTSAWTRGGMCVDLTGIWTPDVGSPYSYDAELCTHSSEPSSHDRVLSYMIAGKIRSLRLCIFDIIDLTRTFGQRLLMLSDHNIPAENLVRYHMVNLWRGPSLMDRLHGMDIGSPGCEGVIIRNPRAKYDPSGRRSNRSIFKVKAKTLSNIR